MISLQFLRSRCFGSCLALVVAPSAFGCGSKGAVSLSARVDNASVSARSVALGTQVSGEFELVLELGAAAPDATSVSLGAFALKSAQRTLVDVLAVTASDAFPLDVPVGQAKSVHFVLDDTALVDADVRAGICDGEVWLAGTVTDTLSDGRPTVASSDKLVPTCE